MFFFSGPFYAITIILQVICVIHCVKRGNQQNWIWVIIFLPVIGALIYFFSEIFTNRQIHAVRSGVGEMIQPTGSVKKLEANLRFSDTFKNRIALADALLITGETQRAIDLYEHSLTGAFAENEYAIGQLMIAYYREKRYNDVISLAKKVYKLPQFRQSKAHILYAMSLGYQGNPEAAEKEFLAMKGKFSNFEARYYYSLFLQQNNRIPEAKKLLNEIIAEIPQLSPREKRYHREWIHLAKDTLKKLP